MTPTFVVNESESGLSCMENGATLTVMLTTAGLPLTALPVIGSMAVTVTVAL